MPDAPDLRAQTDDPVFISYSRANTPFARDLYEKLQKLGFKLWRDRSEMEGGGDWWAQIKEAINGAGTMVLVMSPKALASPIVAKEWRYARQVGTRVIPVLAEDVDFKTVPRWMGEMDWLDFRDGAPEREVIWPKFIRQLNTPYEPVRVPFMVDPLPPDFVPRSTELEAIIGSLLRGGGEPVGITAALRGAGGYGKTTLARAVCHDERIQHAFDEGILWVELGEQPGDPIGRVVDLIVVLSGERPPVTGLEAARTRLAELLADKDILMVIDDVWDSAHLKPFLVAAPRCARLITTRSTETLPTGAHKINVDAMQPAEAVALLASGLPDSPRSEGEGLGVRAFSALAARLGEWPLLLKLANGVLRNRVEKGQPLPAALDYMNKALDHKGLSAFNQANSSDRHSAVEKTIGVSLDLLTGDERTHYGELAIFPEDVDVPLVMLEKLWGMDDFDVEQLCERLDNLSLLLRFDLAARTVRLHDVIRAYLIREQGSTIPRYGLLDDPNFKLSGAISDQDWDKFRQMAGKMPNLHARFLDAYHLSPDIDGRQQWRDLPHNERYLWDWLGYHLIEAGRDDEFVATALDLHYLATKTQLRDAFAAEADLNMAERYLNARVLNIYDSELPIKERVNLALLRRAFANMTHILNRCKTLPEVMATLHSRLQHLPELAGVCADLEAAIPRPYVTAWHPLPDLPHPALVRTLVDHTSIVTGCAYSPDWRYIVSASDDETLKVWDVQTGAVVRTLAGHTDKVNCCIYSPDGRWIVSASDDRTLKVWNAQTGAEVRTLAGHTSWVSGCAYSPDGGWIVSASWDNTLKVWDAQTGAEVRTLAGHRDRVNSCAYSPDGHWIVSASDDRMLKVWDAQTGAEVQTLAGHSAWVKGCAYSPDGRWIVSASWDNTLKIWDTQSGAEVRILVGHTGSVKSCIYSPDGRWIVSVSSDRTLKVWEAQIGKEVRTLAGHTNMVTACAYSPDGRWIASASGDRTLKVWEAQIGEEARTLAGHTNIVTACACSPDGHWIVSASRDNTLKIWDAQSGAEVRTLVGHTDRVHSCAYSLDGHWIVSTSSDQMLKVWDATSGEEIRTLAGHTGEVNACAYSPDGRWIVSASGDQTLKVWDATSGEVIWTLAGHTYDVIGCAYSPNGRWIVSASWDNTLKIWDAQSGAEVRTLTGHTGEVNSCAYSPDGRWIVSAAGGLFDDDRTLKMWDATSGEVIWTLAGHTGEVNSCVYSPDGRWIMSVSDDNTLKLWDAQTGLCLATLNVENDLRACAFHPDGEHLIAGGDTGLYWLRFVR